ncbi:MAG TPA: phosphoribosyltransferase family protein [Candidatus Sulfotelmatobacter sp.]|jgi:putative phosphoribosyl transferase|nr:phosphoribosyltransferase family protein [Candidatus Sulfotelmatobacter sp.]
MFDNRIDAGRQLVKKVLFCKGNNLMVIAMPRGGIVVGFPIAKALNVPLGVVIDYKIGAPQNFKLGIVTIAEHGAVFLDKELIEHLGISQSTLRLVEEHDRELKRSKQLYRQGESLPLLTNKTIILVDDGLETGTSARAALVAIKKRHPKKIIFAVPICSEEVARTISSLVDTVICLQSVKYLEAIGKYYKDFRQVSDNEVITLLQKSKEKFFVMNPQGEDSFNHKIVW